jgi:hypothetical protein
MRDVKDDDHSQKISNAKGHQNPGNIAILVAVLGGKILTFLEVN